MNKKKEQIKGLLLELLPQPISSGKELIAGDPPEIIAKLTDEGFIIAPYKAKWTNPYTLKPIVPNAALMSWNRLPEQTEQLRAFLSQKIKATQHARKTTFTECKSCHKSTPPELMHDGNTCQACSTNKKGIVY